MEPEIRADLPTSSPIVAYGATRQPGGRKFLAIIAGSFVLVLIGFLAWAGLSWKVPFPTNVLALAAIHGDADLPLGTPVVWQQAARAHHPIILGLATSDAGLTPFAITLDIDGVIGHEHSASWPFVFSSDAPLTMTETRHVTDLLWLVARLGQHTAYISADPRSIAGTDTQPIQGPFDRMTWRTDVSLASSANAALPPGDISMDLDALPEAWPLVRDAIKRSQPSLALDEQPLTLSWTASTDTAIIVATYESAPSTSTLLAFANAAGIFEATPLTLPDGTVAQELGPPLQEIATSGASAFSSSSDTRLMVQGNTITFGSALNTDRQTDASCRSKPGIFAVSRRIVETYVPFLHSGLFASAEQDHLVLETCGETP